MLWCQIEGQIPQRDFFSHALNIYGILSLLGSLASQAWCIPMSKVTCLRWNSVLGYFWDRWLRIWTQNLEIQNSGRNIATRIKKLLDLDKTGWRFSGSLFTDLRSKLINSKWWMQQGGPKCKKLLHSDGTHLNKTWLVSPNGIYLY